ncbi:hypothetical protein BDQ17DRAFT_1374279, partial [Cyathus striatus]
MLMLFCCCLTTIPRLLEYSLFSAGSSVMVLNIGIIALRVLIHISYASQCREVIGF